ncbi:hypothetical protein EJ110_NYTH50170 [Nymphaea thermarum]|nr:hypothetical protein EJ110_NYTH50170 [Nymphaea thermarum]
MAVIKFMRTSSMWAYEAFGTKKAIILLVMATLKDILVCRSAWTNQQQLLCQCAADRGGETCACASHLDAHARNNTADGSM